MFASGEVLPVAAKDEGAHAKNSLRMKLLFLSPLAYVETRWSMTRPNARPKHAPTKREGTREPAGTWMLKAAANMKTRIVPATSKGKISPKMEVILDDFVAGDNELPEEEEEDDDEEDDAEE